MTSKAIPYWPILLGVLSCSESEKVSDVDSLQLSGGFWPLYRVHFFLIIESPTLSCLNGEKKHVYFPLVFFLWVVWIAQGLCADAGGGVCMVYSIWEDDRGVVNATCFICFLNWKRSSLLHLNRQGQDNDNGGKNVFWLLCFSLPVFNSYIAFFTDLNTRSVIDRIHLYCCYATANTEGSVHGKQKRFVFVFLKILLLLGTSQESM